MLENDAATPCYGIPSETHPRRLCACQTGGRCVPLDDPLHRIDTRLERVETKLSDHIADAVPRLTGMEKQLHDLDNWRLEMSVYVRQIRWLIVLVVAALVTGLINIVLNLELHA